MKTPLFLTSIKFAFNFGLCFLLITSCEEARRQTAKKVDHFELPGEVKDLIKEDTILVIPRAGCTGCIDEVVDFVLKNLDSLDGYKIVFTGIEGLKELKVRLGTFYSNDHIYLDTSNVFYRPGSLVAIYPLKLVRISSSTFSYEIFQPKK